MRKSALVSLLLLLSLGCVRTPVEQPLVDLDTIARRPSPPAPMHLDTRNSFLRLYPAPAGDADRAAWREGLELARAADRKRIEEDSSASVFDIPALAWTQGDFVQAPALLHDRFLYDPGFRRFTVDRFLDDLKARYGGVESVVLWHAYPNLGIDERNQFDFLRGLPGGLPALKRMIDDFHRRGVKVLFPVSPWDKGTRAEGRSAPDTLARIAKDAGADGLHVDASVAPDRAYVEAAADIGHPFAVEPEGGLGDSIESILWTPMSWADWREYREAPGVDRYRWAERRFLNHAGSRDPRNRLDDFQYAWFNGAGVLAWENVFGGWNGFSPRDAEIVRRMAMIYRAFPDFPRSPKWEPHAPILPAPGVYASRWPLPYSGTIWTFVNRSSASVSQPLLEVEYRGQHFYDLWTGEEIHPEEKLINRFHRGATVSVSLEGHGFGAVLETNEPPRIGSNLYHLLEDMRRRARYRPERLSADSRPAPQRMVEISPSPKFLQAPEGMVRIPAARRWRFRVTGIEHDSPPFLDVQYPWETHPQRNHDAFRDISAFYLDRLPVTNAHFRRYLEERVYSPPEPKNFLRDWPEGKMPPELAAKPVTWISIEEARAYCRAAGKRLPREWEWQLAAQGLDGRAHPWGSSWDPTRVPAPSLGRERRPGPDVGSFPAGASPYGVLDLQGLIWEWTDEFFDAHTRLAVLKGGSFYQPSGSRFYFPTTDGEASDPSLRGRHRVDTHAKYLLMDPALDRAGTIGFRCAADAAD